MQLMMILNSHGLFVKLALLKFKRVFWAGHIALTNLLCKCKYYYVIHPLKAGEDNDEQAHF